MCKTTNNRTDKNVDMDIWLLKTVRFTGASPRSTSCAEKQLPPPRLHTNARPTKTSTSLGGGDPFDSAIFQSIDVDFGHSVPLTS